MAKVPKPTHRLKVDVKAVSRLTHLSIRASRNLLTDIRKKLGKAIREWITLREFCEMTPFKTEDVIPYLE
jgi:hypothetical protein